jgi:hypothetical protein
MSMTTPERAWHVKTVRDDNGKVRITVNIPFSRQVARWESSGENADERCPEGYDIGTDLAGEIHTGHAISDGEYENDEQD